MAVLAAVLVVLVAVGVGAWVASSASPGGRRPRRDGGAGDGAREGVRNAFYWSGGGHGWGSGGAG